MPKIILERLYADAQTPSRGTDGAAGYDVCAYLTNENPGKLFGLPENRLANAMNAWAPMLVDAAVKSVGQKIQGFGNQSPGAFFMDTLEEPRIPNFWGGKIEVPGGYRALIPTGLKMRIPPGWEVQVRPRSGLALKSGITILNAPGTIDSDYRGELGIILLNTSTTLFTVEHGARIAQLVALPTFEMRFEEGSVDADTERSEGGFGSTGT